MAWYTLLGIIGSAIGISGAAWTAIKYWHNLAVKSVTDSIKLELKPVAAEVSRNGGQSLKDQVIYMREEMHSSFTEVRSHLNRQDARIDRLYERLDD